MSSLSFGKSATASFVRDDTGPCSGRTTTAFFLKAEVLTKKTQSATPGGGLLAYKASPCNMSAEAPRETVADDDDEAGAAAPCLNVTSAPLSTAQTATTGSDGISDRALARRLISEEGGNELRQFSSKLKDDKDLVLHSVASSGHALEFASTRLQGDKDVVTVAVNEDAYAMQYASHELRSNTEFLLSLWRENARTIDGLLWATDDVRNDAATVTKALQEYRRTIREWFFVFKWMGKKLRDNVSAAVKILMCLWKNEHSNNLWEPVAIRPLNFESVMSHFIRQRSSKFEGIIHSIDQSLKVDTKPLPKTIMDEIHAFLGNNRLQEDLEYLKANPCYLRLIGAYVKFFGLPGLFSLRSDFRVRVVTKRSEVNIPKEEFTGLLLFPDENDPSKPGGPVQMLMDNVQVRPSPGRTYMEHQIPLRCASSEHLRQLLPLDDDLSDHQPFPYAPPYIHTNDADGWRTFHGLAYTASENGGRAAVVRNSVFNYKRFEWDETGRIVWFDE